MPYANNKAADQPAHLCSLISAFVVRYLDSIIPLVSIYEISSLYLASVAVQTGLSVPWSQTSKTGFLVTRLIYKDFPDTLRSKYLISFKCMYIYSRSVYVSEMKKK